MALSPVLNRVRTERSEQAKIMLLRMIPDWNSIDSVRVAHSRLELGGIVFFALLAIAEGFAHNEKDKKREHWFNTFGVWFFAIAVACEIAGYVYGQRNDSLSEGKITSLDALVHDADSTAIGAKAAADAAKVEAGGANFAAAIAQGNADAANKAARLAESKASTAGMEADEVAADLTSANSEIKDLETKRAELEKSLAPRNFATLAPPELDELRAFSGTKFVLRYLPDAEPERAAASLAGVLEAAGWKMSQATPDPSKNAPFFDGVLIGTWSASADELEKLPPPGSPERMETIRRFVDQSSRSNRTAEQAVDFLVTHGWAGRNMPSDEHLPPDTLVIIVGFKPNPYFDTEEMKKVNSTLEQIRQRELDEERKMDEFLKRSQLGNPSAK